MIWIAAIIFGVLAFGLFFFLCVRSLFSEMRKEEKDREYDTFS